MKNRSHWFLDHTIYIYVHVYVYVFPLPYTWIIFLKSFSSFSNIFSLKITIITHVCTYVVCFIYKYSFHSTTGHYIHTFTYMVQFFGTENLYADFPRSKICPRWIVIIGFFATTVRPLACLCLQFVFVWYALSYQLQSTF